MVSSLNSCFKPNASQTVAFVINAIGKKTYIYLLYMNGKINTLRNLVDGLLIGFDYMASNRCWLNVVLKGQLSSQRCAI